MTNRVLTHCHTTECGECYVIRYHAGHTLDAMLAVQKWAEDDELDFAWADANEVLEAMYQVFERLKIEGRLAA